MTPHRPRRRYEYQRDPAAIYAQSFSAIREEGDFSRIPANARKVAVRMVHACGQVDLVEDLVIHPELLPAARSALEAGAPILTDSSMIAAGITRARLPAGNEVLCTLRDERTAELSQNWRTTRAAAAVSLWGNRLEGAVVAIGNAPSALFHLLELLMDGSPQPAAIVGVPVGFVGAAESKDALVSAALSIPFLTIRGRRGGSALAAAAVNAIAQEVE